MVRLKIKTLFLFGLFLFPFLTIFSSNFTTAQSFDSNRSITLSNEIPNIDLHAEMEEAYTSVEIVRVVVGGRRLTWIE